jgi:ABC-type branched-subunit amino acid transport system ATPase component
MVDADSLTDISPGLRLHAARAGYGKKEILCGLSLEARPGEILAVLGANGAGKSTALKVAMGILPARAGSVWLGEREITRASVPQRVALGIALMLQGGQVFPSLSVRENLAIGASPLAPQEREPAVAAILTLFPAIAERPNRRAGELSGGERQALALAVTLVRRPSVLLLDEPSASLSPRAAGDALRSVAELCRRQGAATVLVEQRVVEVLHLADRAVWLDGGIVRLETSEPAAWLEGDFLQSLAFEGRYQESGLGA